MPDRPGDEDLVPKRVLDLLPERIALLDGSSAVRWANAAWLDDPPDDIDGIVGRARIGERLLTEEGAATPSAVASGLRAVIERSATHFEVELEQSGSAGPWLVSATRLGLGPIALVVKQGRPLRSPTLVSRAVGNGRPVELAPRSRPPVQVPADLFDEEPTPRERQVLEGMMRGLDNHAIAQELGIGYTSVRAHVRSLIAKAGARSRLEVVARAYLGALGEIGDRDDAAPAPGRAAR